MALYRGDGGSGESTTNTVANQIAINAQVAKDSKEAAEAALAAALIVQNNASSSANNADSSALDAAQSALEAAQSALEAANSALAAAQSATDAANSAAIFDPDDYATAAQGTKADTAFGWGNHALAGYANNTAVTNALALKADDNTVVKLTGNQTIAGIKTFSSPVAGDITGNAATVTNGVYLAATQTLTNKTLDGGTY